MEYAPKRRRRPATQGGRASCHSLVSLAGVPLWALLATVATTGCGGGGGGPGEIPDRPPSVQSTVPADGETGVDVRTTIEVNFSEAMATTGGRLTLAGPNDEDMPLSLPAAGAEWSGMDTRALFTLEDELPAETRFQVTVAELRAADGSGSLEPFVFSFTTGPDEAPPRVVRSVPREGQVDVDPDTLEAIEVTFDEPMDTSLNRADLIVGDDPGRPIELDWDDDGRSFVVVETTNLPYEAEVSLDLSGLADQGGNPVAPDLDGDARLDFTTGPDLFDPFIQNTTPREGQTDVDPNLDEITVIFSEVMDTSVVDFELVPETGDPIPLVGSYSEEALVLTLPLPEGTTLPFRESYRLDLRDARDRLGNTLVADEPLTGDGVLDFSVRAPTGENCDERLIMADGSVDGDAVVFELPPSDDGEGDILSADGGAATCSTATGAVGPDVVFEYVKTTDTLAEGGRALEISFASPETPGLALEVVAGETCAPASRRLDQEQVLCVPPLGDRVQVLDVGPGTYFVFVATSFSALDFPGATVTFREIGEGEVTEGESCIDPLDTSSPSHETTPDGADRWSLGAASLQGFDMDRSFGLGSGAVSCIDNRQVGDAHGVDAVIEFQKTEPDTMLQVEVVSTGALYWEILASGCDPTVPDRRSVGCGLSTNTFEGLIGETGTYHLWLARPGTIPFPAVDVTIREIDTVQPGQACGTGLPLSPGVNEVSPALITTSYQAHGCTSVSSPSRIAWYRYTTTTGSFTIEADGEDHVGVVRPATQRTLTCRGFGIEATGVVTQPGETVCIGIDEGETTRQLTITETDYDGPFGDGPSNAIPIRLPARDDGGPFLVVGVNWVAASAIPALPAGGGSLTAFVGAEGRVLEIELAEGRATERTEVPDGVDNGNAGVDGTGVGGALYSLGFFTESRPNAVFQLWDGASDPWSPAPWDGTSPGYGDLELTDLAAEPDGSALLVLARRGRGRPGFGILSVPIGGGAPVELTGDLRSFGRGDAFAVTDELVYVADNSLFSGARLFRIPRADLSDDMAVPDVIVDTDVGIPEINGLEVVRSGERTYVLFYTESGPAWFRGTHVLEDRGAGVPARYLGRLVAGGFGGVHALDTSGGAPRLVVYDTREGGTLAPQILLLE